MAKKRFDWKKAWYYSFNILGILSILALVFTMAFFQEEKTVLKYIAAGFEFLTGFIAVCFAELLKYYEKFQEK